MMYYVNTVEHRTCRKCRTEKELSEFYRFYNDRRTGHRHVCKKCVSARTTEWNKRHPEQARKARRRNMLRLYGITLEEYENLYRLQNGLCAICREYFAVLCVDHSHETAKVRGLLCRVCNTAIGLLDDNSCLLERALVYLQKERETLRQWNT